MEDQALVTATLGDNQAIQIEVRTTGDPETDVGISETLSFQGFVDSLEAITNSVTSALRSAKPDRATVEFGLDVGVESGGLTALLVKGTGTATLKITLEWESKQGLKDDDA
jgi:Trypsin-co-occurring domain 1